MKQLIRYKNVNGDFEYKFIESFSISCEKRNKKINYYICAHTCAGISQFRTPFNSLEDAENELQLNFGITRIFIPDKEREE